MFDRTLLQSAWDRAHAGHKELQTPEQPDPGVTAFAQRLPQCLKAKPLLDVGCGRGRNAIYLARLGFKVCACDLSTMALSVATALTPQPATAIRWQVADLAQLPYATDTFSVVVCVHVLPYHLKAGIARAMLELRRVLQPGGWLYIDLLDRADAEYGCGPQMEPNTFLDLSGVPMHFSASQEIDEWLQGLTLAHSERRNLISSLGQRVVWEVWATK